MAEVGEVIANPATGERIVFRATRRTTRGRLLEFELRLAPGGTVGPLPHKHAPVERFEVHAGRLSCILTAARHDAGPGESIEIPSGTSHFVWNGGEEEVRATVRVEPAQDFETFFERTFDLAARHPSLRGVPPPLDAVVLAEAYGVYAPIVPIAVQRPILSALATAARGLGSALQLPRLLSS